METIRDEREDPGLRVLVVDDEPDMVATLRDLLGGRATR